MKPLIPAFLLVMTVSAQAPEYPRVWTHYTPVASTDADFKDLIAHGVGLVNTRANSVEAARKALADARRLGMKYSISLPDITEQGSLVRSHGFDPVYALMIGGVYRGKAIDRHLFTFTPARHEIVIEQPVYNPALPYTRGSAAAGKPKATDPVGHYWPDMPAPVKAEIVVPLRRYDGTQHLRIVAAEILPAAAGDRPELDTAAALPDCPEIRNRKLYRLRFDLTGFDNALLDRTGIAVYWPYHGTDQYWLFGKGTVSASAATTRQALAALTRDSLELWRTANGGTFPADVVVAARFGDESFYLAGHTHLSSQAVSFPLWDYSATSIREFTALAGGIEYPRTWGFPELYGPDAYGWWMYSLHKSAAALAGIVREEARKIAPRLIVYRNTTRGGAFSLANDHDGSGPELLTRELDIAHLDPYPVSGTGYSNVIPRDMSYYAGLARRYRKPLIPWLQAHTYTMGKEVLQHVTPAHIEQMGKQHLAHGVDGVVWLGYCPDCTFPNVSPDSWQKAAELHTQLAASHLKPQASMAVLRGYRAWAQTSLSDGLIRNPGDWELQQLLEVWAVKHGKAYDVYELPPRLSVDERKSLARDLKKYRYIVATEPWDGAWMIGQDTAGTTVDPRDAPAVQKKYEDLLKSRRWLSAR